MLPLHPPAFSHTKITTRRVYWGLNRTYMYGTVSSLLAKAALQVKKEVGTPRYSGSHMLM